MPKASRIDPLVHYSRRVRELETQVAHWKAATYYLAGLSAPYIAPNAHPEQLALEAYDNILTETLATNSIPKRTTEGDND